MSTFVAALLNYLRKLHYLGRNFSGAAHVEVWFGGTRMSIAELLHIVASHFEVILTVHYCLNLLSEIRSHKTVVF